MYVPAIGDTIVLTEDWKFTLTDEYRNTSLHDLLFGVLPADPNQYYRRCSYDTKEVTLPKNTVLTIDRVYIKKGQSDYNSLTFIIKKAPFYKKGKIRFWAKLKDVNNIEFEPYIP